MTTTKTVYRLASYCLGQWMWVETWHEHAGLIEYLRKCDRAKYIDINGRKTTAGEYLDEYNAQVQFAAGQRSVTPR